MKIIQIGEILGRDYLTEIQFLSDDYLLDADIIVVDLNSIYEEFMKLYKFDSNEYVVPKIKYDGFISKFNDRSIELQQYLKNGGNIFVSLFEDPKVKIRVQNSSDNNEEIDLDFLKIFGLDSKDFITKRIRGNNIIFPDYDFNSFFSNFFCSYEFIYQKFSGNSVGFIKATNQTVSVCIEKEKGSIILLPRISIETHDDEDIIATDFRLRNAIKLLDSHLKNVAKEIKELVSPSWCNEYYIGSEKEERAKLTELKNKELEIKLMLQEQGNVISELEQLKILLYGSGRNLEIVVEKIFTEIGYEVIHNEFKYRDDLIIKLGEEVAVIEIKGVKSSAAESHAAQLAKWTNNYHLSNGVEPKGILIVNAFKDNSLENRKEKNFPDQMIPYCTKMEFCLLASSDLLRMYLDFKSNRLSLGEFHNMLFETIGEVKYESDSITKI